MTPIAHLSLYRILMVAAILLLMSVAGTQATEKQTKLPYNPDFIPLNQYKDWTDINFISVLTSSAWKPNKDLYLAIYSGTTNGVYFTVASALCDTLRLHFEQHRIHCVALRSQGSADNRRLMRQGRAQMAIMQSDVTIQAASGKEPIPGAQSVMSLYSEMGVLVTRPEAAINMPEDLRGKRINLGPDNTIGHKLILDYLSASGIRPTDMIRQDKFPIESSPQGLCSGYIDAFAVWSGHPSHLVSDAISLCNAHVIGLSGHGMEEILRIHPEYSRISLPPNTYPGQKEQLETYGIQATLVAYEPLDPNIVYWLTRSSIENIDVLRALHPVLKKLTAHDMVQTGNFLPFHAGAARYWREAGPLPPQP
ncbi:TAXI family TRAP transporter solute-binding subunit [Magnetospirillum molischianum]|uniref:Putative TRAP transporter solute receptor, TAXI family n=1 Tax=Magnetospirillum molischianum DSM 120 TaxID=1150626 RepID=H8FV48_MAGML|nr:TAXI family TRAP transporter solute-binding subunit [Magnetospirillum molischianum]CCG42236.1 putative TRAP transporter solute receptor, TAXI family [Magnetospirillum molischianum DSM 120]